MTPIRPFILGPVDTALGWVLMSQADSRTRSATYVQLRDAYSMNTWGLTLLLTGVLILLSGLLHHRLPPQVRSGMQTAAAIAGAAWMTYWAVVLKQTADLDPLVSYAGAVVFLGFGTVPHLVLAFRKEG